MVFINTITISPPLLNSSCAWSSDIQQLKDLYESQYTGAITTRTATLGGYKEDPSVHTVAFSTNTLTTINSYGYSPHPLSQYLIWVESTLTAHPSSSKPIILSITASEPGDLRTMVNSIQQLRSKLKDGTSKYSKIAVELNTSCPNIPNSPPSGYTFKSLLPLLNVLADAYSADRTLTIGLKLPPYTFKDQFNDVFSGLESLANVSQCPISFLTCTNTLGNSLLFSDQSERRLSGEYAVPTALGGLAGDSLHALAMGNVFAFKELFSSQRAKEAGLSGVKIIGVGGVTSRAAVKRMERTGADAVGTATFFGKVGVSAFEILSKD